MNVIEVNNLEKSYKDLKALDKVTFSVKKGEILGLLGPNGSGKSTAINCMLSLINYEGGSIKIFGKEMTPDAYDIKSKIGVVFQDVAVFDELKVHENINYFCGLYIKNKQERKKLMENIIELTGLNDHRNFYPKKLSGGLLRRLNIACGIAHNPEIIFLDEPTVAVDPQSRNNILDGIKKLNDKGATIVYTSHYMEEVEQICDKIIILDKGKIIAAGTNDELKNLVNVDEKVNIEDIELTDENIKNIRESGNVQNAKYKDNNLHIEYKKGENNLGNLVVYLNENKIGFSKIYSERPTLNDVFLELTGKELRD